MFTVWTFALLSISTEALRGRITDFDDTLSEALAEIDSAVKETDDGVEPKDGVEVNQLVTNDQEEDFAKSAVQTPAKASAFHDKPIHSVRFHTQMPRKEGPQASAFHDKPIHSVEFYTQMPRKEGPQVAPPTSIIKELDDEEGEAEEAHHQHEGKEEDAIAKLKAQLVALQKESERLREENQRLVREKDCSPTEMERTTNDGTTPKSKADFTTQQGDRRAVVKRRGTWRIVEIDCVDGDESVDDASCPGFKPDVMRTMNKLQLAASRLHAHRPS